MLRIHTVSQGIDDGRVEEMAARKKLDWSSESNLDPRGKEVGEIDL